MASSSARDLVVLVPDQDIELAIREILNRPESIGTRKIAFDTFRHEQRDAGCFVEAADFLRPFQNKFRHAMVVFDRHGSGQETEDRLNIETKVEQRLDSSGWAGRSCAICIEPELENWLWVDSPVLLKAIGWTQSYQELRSRLIAETLWRIDVEKPVDPKATLRMLLREAHLRPSAAIFQAVAQSASLRRCEDPSFGKFKQIVQAWYPPEEKLMP